MNTKKMFKRILPVAIALVVILAVAISCVLIPEKESRTHLSDYSNQEYFNYNGVSISNDKVYELLLRAYGDDDLVNLVDEYLMKTIKSVSDPNKSYYDLAEEDTEGVDKLITDDIFGDGRAVDALKANASAADIKEAEDADNETIAEWYNTQLSSTNASSLADIRAPYVLTYAKKLYTIDYLMDKAIYEIATSTLSILDQYVAFAIEYMDDVKTLEDDALYNFEKSAYALLDNVKESILKLVNASWETTKAKSVGNGKKIEVILNSSVTEEDITTLACSKWATKDDATAIDNFKEEFLSGLKDCMNNAGAEWADVSEMTSSKYAPTITDANKSTYEAEFVNDYYAIIVTFNSLTERNNALAQCDLAIIDYTLVHYAKYYEEYNKFYLQEEGVPETVTTDDEKQKWAKDQALAADGVLVLETELLSSFAKVYNLYHSTYKLEGEDLVVDKLAIENTTALDLLVEWLQLEVTEDNQSKGANFDLDWLNEADGIFYQYQGYYDFLDQFRFTSDELSNISATANAAITTSTRSLALYKALSATASTFDLKKTYSPMTSSSDLCFALNLGYRKGTAYGNLWSDLTKEQQQAKNVEYLVSDVEGDYTAATLKSTMATLRDTFEVEIYDDVVAAAYTSSYNSSYEVPDGKANNLVASFDGLELTPDDLFAYAVTHHGLTTILSLYEQDWFINSKWSRASEVYKDGKWLEKSDAYEEIISEELESTISTFNYYNYYYAQYGYETLEWEDFLTQVYFYYGVSDTDSLKWFFVYQDAEESYQKEYVSIGELVDGSFNYDNIVKYNGINLDNSGNKTLWDVVYTDGVTEAYNLMDTIDTDYFGITGFHILISLEDEDGNKVDAADWNDAQKKFGEEFYNKLRDMLNGWEQSEWQTKWTSFATEFNNNCPVYVPTASGALATAGLVKIGGAKEAASLDDGSYDYAIYKTLGFELTCETLKEITTSSASSYDSGFVDGIKLVYNKITTRDGVKAQSDLHEVNEGYITGSFGYHCYVATSVSIASKYSLTVNSTAKELEYTNEFLTKELIIYLTREAEDDDENIQIDDAFLALCPDSEFARVMNDWYSAGYSYEGFFKDIVDAVRALDKTALSGITEEDNSDSNTYYVTAKKNSGEKDPVQYAQYQYMLDLLTKYANDMISRYYTPIKSELAGSSSNTGYDYAIRLANIYVDITTSAFKFNGVTKNINLVENGSCNFPVLHLDDKDVTISYTDANGKTNLEYQLRHTLDHIIEGYTYIGDFVEHQLNLIIR